MSEILTLNMDSEVVKFASNFSRKINKPISRIVEDYFIEFIGNTFHGYNFNALLVTDDRIKRIRVDEKAQLGSKADSPHHP